MVSTKTLRFCDTCNKNTLYQYVNTIKHSRCQTCGKGHFSSPYSIKKEVISCIEELEVIASKNQIDISSLMKDLKNRVNNIKEEFDGSK